MKMMKKNLILGIVIIVLIVTIGLYFQKTKKPLEETASIRIGAAIALTGYGASFGQSELNAIDLLKDKYPTLKFYVEDNKSAPNSGIMAVKKLIEIHNVDIVYCDLTTVANAVISITNEHEKVLIASVYLNNLLERSPYAIRNLPRGVDEAKLLLDNLYKESPSAKKIVAIASNDEFGRTSLEDFKMVSMSYDLVITFEDLIPDNEKQIKSFAKKIVVKSPDVVYAASLMPSLGLLIKELRLANYGGEIITTDAFAFPYIQDRAGPYAKNTLYIDFPSTSALKDFEKKYREKYSLEISSTAVLCYDGLSLIIDASLQSGKKPKDIVNGLDGMQYDGLYGNVIIDKREIIYPIIVKKAK